MHDNVKLQVTIQCWLRFSISSKLINEVDLDVVPLDVCGIELGIPYLYDKKAIFFQHEKNYHLTKYGVEYIVRAHGMKYSSFLVNEGYMKIVVSDKKNLVLTVAK